MIFQPVPPQGGDGSHADTENKLGNNRRGHQQQTRRQPGRQKRGHRGPLEIASSEIPPNQIAQIANVLLKHRVVEPELLPNIGHRLGTGAAPGNLPGRVSGHQIEKNERDTADPQEYHGGLEDSPQDVLEHN